MKIVCLRCGDYEKGQKVKRWHNFYSEYIELCVRCYKLTSEKCGTDIIESAVEALREKRKNDFDAFVRQHVVSK